MNIEMRNDGGVKISAAAYVRAKAETYLPMQATRRIPLLRHPFDAAVGEGLRDSGTQGTSRGPHPPAPAVDQEKPTRSAYLHER
eukprot:5934012-Pleurochrysis_carterae.AAC.1